jgi:tetratricopeptide (TPR) repeat protein
VKVKTEEEKSVYRLISTFQCLQLALQQAVAYIRSVLQLYPKPIQKYLEIFENEDRKLLGYMNGNDLSRGEKTTLITWKVTMEKIEREEFGKLSIRLMNILACLDPDDIPISMFYKMTTTPGTSTTHEEQPTEDEVHGHLKESWLNRILKWRFRAKPIVTVNGIQQEKPAVAEVHGAIVLLKTYSMISAKEGSGGISIHRLVQRVVRLNMEKNSEAVLIEGMTLLEKYLRYGTLNTPLVKSLLSHSEVIWRHAMKYPGLIKKWGLFPDKVCKKLDFYGKYNVMLQLARDSILALDSILGERHESTMRITLSEAVALFRLNNYDEALKICVRLRFVSKGEEHSLTLVTSSLMALSLGRLGKFEEELEMQEEILRIRLKLNGPEHKNTLSTLHNKAFALFSLGKHEESLELFQNVYDIRRRVLGENDASTLNTRYFIALALQEKGKLDEALHIFESVYESRKCILGEDHPDTLDTLLDKGITLGMLNQIDDSFKAFQEFDEVAKRVLDKDHLLTWERKKRLQIWCDAKTFMKE